MCGIVGYITTETKTGELDRSRFMRQGLIIDTLRGDDSTGAYGVFHKPDDPYWFKMLGGGGAFVNANEYWENFADVSHYRSMVGHNRAATMGGVSVDSAHPFVEGPITLVHNGTLVSTYNLPAGSMVDLGLEVDSHAIAKNLAECSVEDVVSKLNGAFALVWHDSRDDSMNIVRNSKRPLHFGLGRNTLYFMSEGEMLALLDSRLKLGISTIYYPTEGQYLKWLPDTPLDHPITKELELFEDYWSRPTGAYSTGYYNQARYGGYSGYGSGSDWDGDYEYNYPKAPTRVELKANHIIVGGSKKEVPMILQEALLQYDVVVEDRWEFTPTVHGLNPQDRERNYVVGTLSPLGENGIIYSTSPIKATNTTWTVRCIGVKLDKDGTPWFICRLVSTFVNPALISKPVDMKLYDEPNNSTPPRGMVMGSEGMYVPKSTWYAEVVDGCVMCHKTISISDADDIVWVSEGPICTDCDDRLYEPIESRSTCNENEGETQV